MELGKYEDIAQNIVTTAVKELAIEKGIKELAEVWKSMNFTVVKHYKGCFYYLSNILSEVYLTINELNQSEIFRYAIFYKKIYIFN